MLSNAAVSRSTPPSTQLPDTRSDEARNRLNADHTGLRPGLQTEGAESAREIDAPDPISPQPARELPLLHAAIETYAPAEEVTALLAADRNFIYDVDEDGNTALHFAAAHRFVNPDVIPVLIAAGGPRLLTATNQRGMTAFDVANASNNDLLAFELGRALEDTLKEQAWGRDPNGACWRRLNEECSSLSLTEFQSLVSRVGGPNSSDGRGITPLMVVAWTSRIDLAGWLLSQGAKINEKSRWVCWSRTALLAAVYSRQRDMVRLLLQHGADVSISVLTGIPGRCDFNILDTAVIRQDVEILKDILGPASARLWCTDQIAWALDVAAGAGHFDGVRILLDRAADVPLGTLTYVASKAAFAGANDVLMLLLEQAVDVNAYCSEDPARRTLTDLATEGGQSETVALLTSKGGLRREALDFQEPEGEQSETAALLTSQGEVVREKGPRNAAEPARGKRDCVLL